MSNDLRLGTGLVSGIDSAALVDALTARQKEPMNIAERKAYELKIQKEEYQSIFSSISALEDSALQLSLSATFNRKTAKSSNESVATATATTAAELGSYDLNVTQLAEAHRVASDSVTSVTESLTNSSQTFKVNGISVTMQAGTSLTSMRNALNSIKVQTGVQADIIDKRLVLSSTKTGVANSITMEDTSGTLLRDIGILADNTTSSIGPEDSLGSSLRTVTVGDWQFAPGSMTINGEEIILSGGETFAQLGAMIQDANIPGLSLEISPTGLVFHSENGAVEITDNTGINGSILKEIHFMESPPLGALNLAGKSLIVNGEQIDFTTETTAQEVADTFNAAQVTGVRASIDPNSNSLRIYSDPGLAINIAGDAAPEFGAFTLQTPTTPSLAWEHYNNEESIITVNGEEVTIPAYARLTQIRDAINTTTPDSGVTAAVNAGVLELNSTGPLNIQDVQGTLAQVIGIQSGFKNELKTAKDAIMTINGISVTRAENTVTGALEEVTISLKSLGSSQLNITNDTDTAKTAVLNFVESYNQTIELIDTKLRAKKDYSIKGITEEQKEKMSKEDIEKLDEDLRNQALAGDPLLQRAYNLLRSFSYNRVQGLTGINSLSAMGISTGSIGSNPEQTRIGKLQIVDQTKFDTALNDKLSEVRDFFTRKDEGLTSSQLGIGERLKIELRKFTAFDGLITRKAGRPGQTVSSSLIDRQIASLSLEILNKNRSLLKYQESLLLTFQNMESALSQLQSQSNALSQSSGGL